MAGFEFSEILDKLIETQVQNAQVTAELKNAVEDNNEHLKELKTLLSEVNGHFSNGFRQELKEAIQHAVERIEKNVQEKSDEGQKEAHKILEAVTNFTDCLKNPRSWIGAFLLVASIFGTIAGIVTVVLKLMGGP
jgi:archaellum component FlaC